MVRGLHKQSSSAVHVLPVVSYKPNIPTKELIVYVSAHKINPIYNMC